MIRKKYTKNSLIERTLRRLEKREFMKTQRSQYKTRKALWPKRWWPQEAPPLLCLPVNKGQTSILTGFDRASSNDIRRGNEAQLEMAIADFFHCENIADRVVESPRFKYMLKQARLVGGEFRPPTRKKIGGEKIFNFTCCYVTFSNIMKVNC